VYWSAAPVALVPPGVVTVTSTAVPDVPAGEVAVMVVALLTLNDAAVAPKLTAVAPVKFVPVMVTSVPFGPDAGATLVTVGAGGAV
jgi:hypothetical protein